MKRELPEDAKRFAGIDENVKHELKTLWSIKNVDKGCNLEGLLKRYHIFLSKAVRYLYFFEGHFQLV